MKGELSKPISMYLTKQAATKTMKDAANTKNPNINRVTKPSNSSVVSGSQHPPSTHVNPEVHRSGSNTAGPRAGGSGVFVQTPVSQGPERQELDVLKVPVVDQEIMIASTVDKMATFMAEISSSMKSTNLCILSLEAKIDILVLNTSAQVHALEQQNLGIALSKSSMQVQQTPAQGHILHYERPGPSVPNPVCTITQ